MLEVMQRLLVTSRGLCSDSVPLLFFLPQVYLTVLKHGDSATLDTMLKVSLAAGSAASHGRIPAR